MSVWNAKGDTATTIIMWLGGIIAIAIMLLWFMRTIYPSHNETDLIDENLKDLQLAISDACNSRYYLYRFNPTWDDEGVLAITNQTACMHLRQSKCVPLICNIGINESFQLRELVHLVIEKENGTFTFTPT